MLQVAFIRDYKGTVLKGLAKRNFANAEVVLNDVLSIDDERKSTQTQLDNILAESNKLSKEIGILYKNGEPQKATILKQKTSQLKDDSKVLTEKLSQSSEKLNLHYLFHES